MRKDKKEKVKGIYERGKEGNRVEGEEEVVMEVVKRQENEQDNEHPFPTIHSPQ